jgi:fermentation-respiration switch protein FrsA (DUF1100 family)
MLTDADLAVIAGAAYSTKPRWAVGDVRATWSARGDIDVIAFRGTDPESLADWLRDLDFWPTWRPQLGTCHRGFITGAEGVLPWIRQDMAGRRLVLTGHSLGGALAISLAALLVALGIPVWSVVTFGAPRVGLWQLRKLMAPVPVRQYIDADDPVPQVPRPYLHVRDTISIGAPLLDLLDAHAVARYASLVPATHVAA